MKRFEDYLDEFDKKYGQAIELDMSKILNGVHNGKNPVGIINRLIGSDKEHLEEYYKWQFIYAYVMCKLAPAEKIGVEISLPKGNIKSSSIRMDAVIFDDENWIDHYIEFHKLDKKDDKKWTELEWLEEHIKCIIEFKRKDDEDIKSVYSTQLKGAMQMCTSKVVFGIIYDKFKLYLVKEVKDGGDHFYRLAEEFNKKKKNSEEFLPIKFDDTDSYSTMLSLKEMLEFNLNTVSQRDYSKRVLDDLTKVSKSTSSKIDEALNRINVSLDRNGLRIVGYDILVEMLALKIFDEQDQANKYLRFYINPDEEKYSKLSDKSIQNFFNRIKKITEDARSKYNNIFSKQVIDFKNENHIEFLICIVKNFQDFALTSSERSNLYQLVFNKFASHYNKDSDCQFVTPLPLIDFIVDMVQPKVHESIIDPTCGIADFLAVSFLKSKRKISETNIYGIDIDQSMIDLATLNMLLNNDGNAKLYHKGGLGSIKSKIGIDASLIDLIPKEDEENLNNYNGDWDNRLDGTQIKKFDCVLTNPPFGKARPFIPQNEEERKIAECYETYNNYKHDYIDKGIIFTENAVRLLNENGRIAIVLSNSLCSVEEYVVLREWLFKNLRIVAIIDLPAGTFAEAGVPVTVIIGYRPNPKRLKELLDNNYNVYARKITKIGYKVVDKSGKKGFEHIPKLNPNTFEREINKDGSVKLDEEFTETVQEFREWCKLQECEIINGFLLDDEEAK